MAQSQFKELAINLRLLKLNYASVHHSTPKASSPSRIS